MEIKYIKIDETSYWDAEFLAALGGAKMEATYLFDASVRTCCCEARPSYWMVYAGTEIIPGSREITEAEHERVLQLEARVDNDHYLHCSDVKDAKEFEGDFDESDTMDDVLEAFMANPV